MQVREKVEKLWNTLFLMICGSGGWKVGSLKRRARSHLGRWEMKNCTSLGAKHMSKSKLKKHFSFGAFLKVEILKKCTPLWREAHFQVERVKNWRSRTILEVPPWWHKRISKSKVLRLTVSDHFSMSRCGKCALQLQLQLQLQLHYSYSYHYSSTTLQYTTLQLQLQRQMQLQPQLQLSQLQLHYTTSITLQLQLQLHYTTLQYSTLQVQLQLHYINWSTLTTPHHTTLQYSTVLHTTSQNYRTG